MDNLLSLALTGVVPAVCDAEAGLMAEERSAVGSPPRRSVTPHDAPSDDRRRKPGAGPGSSRARR